MASGRWTDASLKTDVLCAPRMDRIPVIMYDVPYPTAKDGLRAAPSAADAPLALPLPWPTSRRFDGWASRWHTQL